MPQLIEVPALVDRETEQETLGDLLARASDGTPGLALVSGEVGIGKSRLVSSFAAASGARVLRGSSFPVAGESTPYAPVIQAFRDLGRALGPDERARLTWCWPHELAPLERRAPAPGRPAEGEVPASLSSQGRLLENVLSTLTELASSGPGSPPVLVVLEDLHWADRSTLDLVSFLVRNLRDERVLLVLTLRTDEPPRDAHLRDWYAELVRLDEVTVVALSRLDPEQTREHLSHLLHRPVSSEEVARVHHRTDGNPLFTEQALPWVLAQQDEIPESLRGLVAARLAALPADTRLVLDVAAVLGRATTLDTLSAVAEQPPDQVEAALRPALERLVVRVEQDAYVFAHPLLREVIDVAVQPDRRRALHRAAARELSSRSPGPDDHDLAGQVAFHWQAAGVPRLAFEASVSAGLAAEGLHAFIEADEHYARALDVLADLDTAPVVPHHVQAAGLDLVDLLVHAAQAAHLVGDGGRAADLADRAAAECRDPAARAEIWVRKGSICINAGMPVEAEAAYDAALALLPDDPHDETRVRALTGRAILLVSWSRFDEAEQACREARVAAAAGDFPRETGRALMAQGLLLAYRGRPDEGADLLLESLDLAYEVADPDDLGTTLINAGHVLGLAGRYDEAVAVCAAGYDALRTVGLARQDGAFLRANAVDCLLRAGRWEEAETLIEQALADRPRGLRGFPVLLLGTRLHVVRGRLDQARRLATEMEALSAEHGCPDAWLREQREATAALAWWDGRPEEAWEIASGGLDAIADSGEQVFAARLGAIAARALGDLAERDGRVPGQLSDLLARLGTLRPDPLDPEAGLLPDSRAWSCTLAAELGRARRASDPREWSRAVDAWTAADDAFFLLYARWRHAEALVMRKTAGEASVRAVREAHAAAERLGAALVLAEVEKLARWGRVDLVAGEEDAHPPLPADEYGLTEREREVLASLVDGRTNREIAEAMFISVKTASVHVSNILRKLGVANREEAARLGSRMRGPDPAPGAGNNDAPTLR